MHILYQYVTGISYILEYIYSRILLSPQCQFFSVLPCCLLCLLIVWGSREQKDIWDVETDSQCHILYMNTTKVLPCLMQNTEIWKPQCARRIGEISGSCLFPNVVTKSPQKSSHSRTMHFTLVWALWACLLTHAGQRAELGDHSHQTYFFLQARASPCAKYYSFRFLTEAKRLGSRDWVSFGGQAVWTNPFAVTGTYCSSPEQGRVVPLHLCLGLGGKVGSNSTSSPNLVLASSWEKEKWESAVQLG